MNKLFSLRERFMTQGTLSDPEGIPDPAFSLPATLNWMRALAILVESEEIGPTSMSVHFLKIQRTVSSDRAINTVYEQLLMALHHLSAIRAMQSHPKKIDAARSAIVTWYYGIFHSASAMIAAQDGSYQENHTETANAWDRQFASVGMLPKPFNYRVSTLVTKDVESEILAIRAGNTHGLDTSPSSTAQATGACMSYLKGSAKWRSEFIEQELLRREMKKLGLLNFRTKQARELRDERLAGRSFGFLHQSFRYRGKANYREALFISYGSNIESQLANFYIDLNKVLTAFISMAGAFCSRRIGKDAWNDYILDLIQQTNFTVKVEDVWHSIS